MPNANLGTGSCTSGGVATLSCIFPLLATFVVWLLTFASVVALFFVIFAGFRFLTSGGDPKAVESARKILTFAILGLVVVFLSFFILTLISQITGVGCINPNFLVNPTNPFMTCNQ